MGKDSYHRLLIPVLLLSFPFPQPALSLGISPSIPRKTFPSNSKPYPLCPKAFYMFSGMPKDLLTIGNEGKGIEKE